MDLDSYPKTSDTSPFILRLSKGCYWQRCAFCRCDIYHCKNYFQPNVEQVVNEIFDTVADLKPNAVLFSDESVNPEIMEYFCNEKIKRKIPFFWGAHSRVSKELNAKRALLFKEAGCKHFFVGVESFSDRVLKLMKKGITEQLIKNVLNEFGDKLPLSVYLMSGFPTESKEEMIYNFQHSKKYMDEKKIVSISNSFFSVAYGSEIWNNPSKYNIILPEANPYCDLNYDILDFSYTSDQYLSRKEAYHIYMKNVIPHKPNALLIQKLDIKQDLSKIQQKIIDWTFEVDKHTSLPLWLQENDEIIYER